MGRAGHRGEVGIVTVDAAVPVERHCKACGARLVDGRTCDSCGAVHCSRRACGVLLDVEAKPARCPDCGTFTPWNRSHESHGLSGRHAKAQRAQAVPDLVDAILVERGLTREKATRTVIALATQAAQAQCLRESGYEAAAVNGPKTTGGAAGLKAFTQAVDREQRAIHLLQTLAPLSVAGAEDHVVRGIEMVIVDADGTVLQHTARVPVDHIGVPLAVTESDSDQGGRHLRRIERHIVDPEGYWSPPAIVSQQVPQSEGTAHTPAPAPEPVIEAEVIAPVPEPKPERLTAAQHRALLVKQTRRLEA